MSREIFSVVPSTEEVKPDPPRPSTFRSPISENAPFPPLSRPGLLWIWGVVMMVGLLFVAGGYFADGYESGAANACNETPFSCSQGTVNSINQGLANDPLYIGFGFLVTAVGVSGAFIGISRRIPPPPRELTFTDTRPFN